MSAVDTDLVVRQIRPLGGTSQAGWKLGIINSGAKASQNDTWTITNADEIMLAFVTDDSAGTHDACTISTNVITLTGAATGAATGLLIYR